MNIRFPADILAMVSDRGCAYMQGASNFFCAFPLANQSEYFLLPTRKDLIIRDVSVHRGWLSWLLPSHFLRMSIQVAVIKVVLTETAQGRAISVRSLL